MDSGRHRVTQACSLRHAQAGRRGNRSTEQQEMSTECALVSVHPSSRCSIRGFSVFPGYGA